MVSLCHGLFVTNFQPRTCVQSFHLNALFWYVYIPYGLEPVVYSYVHEGILDLIKESLNFKFPKQIIQWSYTPIGPMYMACDVKLLIHV